MKSILFLCIPVFVYSALVNKFTVFLVGEPLANFIIVLVVISFLISLFFNLKKVINGGFYTELILLIFFTALLTVKLFFSFDLGSRAFSSYVRLGLLPFFVFVPFSLLSSNSEKISLLRTVCIASFPVAILAVVQFLFFEHLPEFLLNYKAVGERLDLHGYGDITLFRSHGMFGNPLEFSTFMFYVLAVVFFYLRGLQQFVFASFAFLSILATLSRASIILMPLVFIFRARDSFRKIVPIVSAIFTILLVALIFADSNIPLIDALVDRISGATEESQSSTDLRYGFLSATLDKILSIPYFFTGYELGSYTSGGEEVEKDVHDGFFLDTVIEFGVPLFIIYVLFHLMLLFKGVQLCFKNRGSSDGPFVIVMLVSWFAFCIINSAMLNASCSAIFYICLGCGLFTSRRYV